MSNFSIALREFLNLEEEIWQISNLQKKVLKVFNPCSSLEKINSSLNESWFELKEWAENSQKKHPGTLEIQDWDMIQEFFKKVCEARINRDEFATELTGTTEGIDDYINFLKEEKEKQYQKIEKEYESFMKHNAEQLEFILNSPQVREIIMKLCGLENEDDK